MAMRLKTDATGRTEGLGSREEIVAAHSAPAFRTVGSRRRLRQLATDASRKSTSGAGNLHGRGWWTLSPLRNGVTDIVVVVPDGGRRQGQLTTRADGRALSISFMVPGIRSLQPCEQAGFVRIHGQLLPVKIWHDIDVHIVRLAAVTLLEAGSNMIRAVDRLVADFRNVFRDGAITSIEARSEGR